MGWMASRWVARCEAILRESGSDRVSFVAVAAAYSRWCCVARARSGTVNCGVFQMPRGVSIGAKGTLFPVLPDIFAV